MTSPNFMVIGLQIRKLHRGAESAPPPPAVLDSKKPGLFRVKLYNILIFGNGVLIAQNFLLGDKIKGMETCQKIPQTYSITPRVLKLQCANFAKRVLN